jgi:hypothetical protein
MKLPHIDKKVFNKKVGKYKLYCTKKDKIIEEKYVPHDDVGLLNQHYKSFKLNKEWRSK